MSIADLVSLLGMIMIVVPLYFIYWGIGSMATGMLLVIWAVNAGPKKPIWVKKEKKPKERRKPR